MKKKTGILCIAILCCILAGLGAFGYYYYSKYVNIKTIYPGVTIEGIPVGGLTRAQAQKKVDAYMDTVSKETVTLQLEEKKREFTLAQAGIACTDTDIVQTADDLGKTGNIFKRIVQIRSLLKEGKDYPLHFTLDSEKLGEIVAKKGKHFLAKKKSATIIRKDGKFIIDEEVDGISIDFDANAKKLLTRVEDEKWNQKSFSFEMEYERDPAKHTKEELSTIKDVLGTFTTSYAGSTIGRCDNVENGARLINATVLYPGDSFSVYKKVAPFTADNGYELAGSYENGKTVQTYGGGICQVSTTLYNAVLRAELEVTERSNHSMTVHYVELSEDAAIAGTDKDLKFENNLDMPVYIEGKAGGNTITFTIYGQEYRPKNRKIEYVSERTSTKSPSEQTIKDGSLEEGKRVVESEGRTGYTAKLWKVTYIDGKETKREQVNTSSYQSTPRVVRVGTKKKPQPKKETSSKKSSNNKKKNDKKSGNNKKNK